MMSLTAATALAAEVAGTVRVSGEPAEQAVVWLEVERPPAFVQTSKVVIGSYGRLFR